MAHVNLWYYPDYSVVVREPLDLGTIGQRLRAGRYVSSPANFPADMRRVFLNALTYNSAGTPAHIMAYALMVGILLPVPDN